MINYWMQNGQAAMEDRVSLLLSTHGIVEDKGHNGMISSIFCLFDGKKQYLIHHSPFIIHVQDMEEMIVLTSSTIALSAHSYIHISLRFHPSRSRSPRKPTPRTSSRPFFKRTNYWMNDFWKSQKKITTLVDVLRIQSF